MKPLHQSSEDGIIGSSRLKRKRLKRDGDAVGLEVEEVAIGVAGLAAGGDVGAASLLDGDGDCEGRSLV